LIVDLRSDDLDNIFVTLILTDLYHMFQFDGQDE